jgi:hypothetical protein
MKCSEINNLLYLKDDELSPLELEEAKEHLAYCTKCAEEFARITKTYELVSKVKESSPFLCNEEEFTNSVMTSIEGRIQPDVQSFTNRLLDKVSLIFLNSAVRAAAFSIIILIVSTFLVQQYLVFRNVSNLENKIAFTGTTQLNNASAGFNELKVIKLTAGLISLIKGDELYADLSGRLILADKSKLNELLTLYSDLQNYRKLYAKDIEEKYPELNEFLEKKLSIEDLQEFVMKNEKMIKELSRKIPAGGK